MATGLPMSTKHLILLPLLVAAALAAAQSPPTFVKDVLPIFERHCHECHYSGAPHAPMALDSYAQVRPWVKAIHKQVETGAMPPAAPPMTPMPPPPLRRLPSLTCPELTRVRETPERCRSR